MNKTRKRWLSSVLGSALIIAIVFAVVFALGFDTAQKPLQDNTLDGAQSVTELITSGLLDENGLTDEESAMAYYNDLVNNQGYKGITSQSEFDGIRNATGFGDANKKYALLPYSGGARQTYSATTSNGLIMRATLDGCGANVSLTIATSGMQEGYRPDVADVGIPTTGTAFQEDKMSGDDSPVWLRLRGGLADAAIGANLYNINFSFTGEYAFGMDTNQDAYIVGGVFATMVGGVIDGCHLDLDVQFDGKKNVNGGNVFKYEVWSRPYHDMFLFGGMVGYLCDGSITNSSIDVKSSSNVRIETWGNRASFASFKGQPRSITGGIVAFVQNSSTVKNIYVKGSGAFTAIGSPDMYEYSKDGKYSSRQGLAGAVIGVVSDVRSDIWYMGYASGSATATIQNFVSEYTGNVHIEGYYFHDSGVSLETSFETGTYSGCLIGNSGDHLSATNIGNVTGMYFLFNTASTANTFRVIANRNTSVAAPSTLIVTSDGVDISQSDDVDVSINGSTNTIDITYTVPQGDESAILWDYDFTTNYGQSDASTATTTFFDKVDGTSVTSISNAKKNWTISIKTGVDKFSYKYDFHTGHAYYYKIDGENGWTFEDTKAGSVGVRTYDVLTKTYDGQRLATPGVLLYSDAQMTQQVGGAVVQDSWWKAISGGITGQDKDLSETRNAGEWYLRLADSANSAVAYDFINKTERYIAYKADNIIVNSSLEDGTTISRRFFKNTVNQKEIKPVLTVPSGDGAIYDGQAKVASANTDTQIIAGDSVPVEFAYYSIPNPEQADIQMPVTSAVDAGEYIVKISGVGNTNYKLPQEEVSQRFTIAKRELGVAFSGYDAGNPFVYNAKTQMPTVTVSNNIEAQDSIVEVVSYVKQNDSWQQRDALNAGEYKIEVSLSVDGMKNYVFGQDVITYYEFLINKATWSYRGQESYSFIYTSYDMNGSTIQEYEQGTEDEYYFDLYNDVTKERSNISAKFKSAEIPVSMPSVKDVNTYTCVITSTTNANYETFTHEITFSITQSHVSFKLEPRGVMPGEDGNYVYCGENIWFNPGTTGIGSRDGYKFSANIYKASDVTFDEHGGYTIAEGAQSVPAVVDAGDYVVIIEQTAGGNLDEDPNYIVDGGERTRAFKVNKKDITFTFSGEKTVTYDGEYHTLVLDEAAFTDMLAMKDRNIYSLSGNVSYLKDGVDYKETGVRNAGVYNIVPEILSTDGSDINTNYNVIGETLTVNKRNVTINANNATYPYGVAFMSLTDEQFRAMWSYPEGAAEENKFVLTDETGAFGPGKNLVIPTAGNPVTETSPRGVYEFILGLNPDNENYGNYELTVTYADSERNVALWTVTGTQLDIDVLVNNQESGEAVTNAGNLNTATISVVYNGFEYTVTLRVNNAVEGYPEIAWNNAQAVVRNVADSGAMVFTLAGNAGDAYYIGEEGEGDTSFTVNFNIDKRTVNVKGEDIQIEYGKSFMSANLQYTGEYQIATPDLDGVFTFKWSLEGGVDINTLNIGESAYIDLEISDADASFDDMANYEFVYAQGEERGKATLIRKQVNVTVTGEKSKVYGEADPTSPQIGVDYTVNTELVGDDTLNLEFGFFNAETGEPVAGGIKLPAGTYKLGLAQTDAEVSKYELNFEGFGTYTVSKKKVGVTLTETNVVYDAKEHKVNAVIDGLVGDGEDKDVAEVSVIYKKDGVVTEGVPVFAGVYTVEIDGITNGNYEIDSSAVTGNGTITIDKLIVNDVIPNFAATPYGMDRMRPGETGDDTVYFTSASEALNTDFANGNIVPTFKYLGEQDIKTLEPGKYEGLVTLEFGGAAADSYEITVSKTSDLYVVTVVISEDTVSLKEKEVTYDGNDHISDIVVVGVVNSEVKITISDAEGNPVNSVVNAGTYSVKVEAVNKMHYTGSATFTFTVNKAVLDAKINGDDDNVLTSEYNGNAVELTIDEKYGEVVFAITKDGAPVDEIKDAGVYNIVITAADSSNYTGSVEATYTVTKATIGVPTRENLNIEVTETTIKITDKSGKFDVVITLDGNNWQDATNTITGLKAETSYTVYVKMLGDGNYNESGVAQITVETAKKEVAILDEKDVTFVAYSDKIVVNVAGNRACAYRINGGEWQDSNTFAGLKNDTQYKVEIKVKANGNVGESAPVSKNVRTGISTATFDNLVKEIGDTVEAADIEKYTQLTAEYDKLADGDKQDKASAFNKVKDAYKAYVSGIASDVIAAQNVAKKAAGRGVAAAASAMVIAAAIAVLAKKKFVL